MIRLPHRTSTRIAAALVAAALAGALAGCSAPRGHALPTATAAHSARASATPAATAVVLACDQLLTPQQAASLHPALTADPGYRAARGSLSAEAASLKGIVCGWRDGTTGKELSVALARPATSSIARLAGRAATQSHVVPTYGIPPAVQGFFSQDGGVGTAQAFAGGYWLIASSPDFREPGDAQPAMAAMLANLPKG